MDTNVYDLTNRELVNAFKKKEHDSILEIASKSIFLIPVQNKNRIEKIAFESMMDSEKHLYLPIFINMADIDTNPIIKGKQVLIAHFGMIEQILNAHSKLYGICINPCTMDCKLDRTESYKICNLYHQNENKLEFEPDFYKKETTNMADLLPKQPSPRSEVIVSFVNKLKTTTIRKAYLTVKPVGNKLHYKFYLDYNTKEISYIDELNSLIHELLNETETYEILCTRQKMNEKMVRFLKPIYTKK